MMAAESIQPAWRLSELLKDVTPVAPGEDVFVRGISIDSRQVCDGDLFLACAGVSDHGLAYLEQALRSGAAAVVWQPTAAFSVLPEIIQSYQAPAFSVTGLASRVGVIASRFFGDPSQYMCLIGVTGTDGKTSCSHFIAQALGEDHPSCGLIGTLGNGIYGQLQLTSHTTPDPISLHSLLSDFHDKSLKNVVMEVSSHALDQERISGVIFSIALFTNLGRDHLDYHRDVNAYGEAKRRLFEQLGLKFAVLNFDDPFSREIFAGLPSDVQVIAYGCTEMPAWVADSPQMHRVFGMLVQEGRRGICLEVDTFRGKGTLRSSLLGDFNAVNLLGALGVLLAQGLELEVALQRLSRVQAVPGRMERFGGEQDQPLVIVDYAHTPQALEHVLSALQKICSGSLTCVFGAGGDRDRGKRALMGACAQQYSGQVILTDDNPRSENPRSIVADILAGMAQSDAVKIEHDRAAAIRQAIQGASSRDVILIAGKGHESYQEIAGKQVRFDDREHVIAVLSEGPS